AGRHRALPSLPTRRSSDLISARVANKLVEDGVVDIQVPSEDLFDRYIAEDIVNPETGEIYVEAGDALSEAVLATLIEAGIDELRSEEHTSELQSREKLVCR